MQTRLLVTDLQAVLGPELFRSLYESDNGSFRRPRRSAAAGRSEPSETEMTRCRLDSLSRIYKQSSGPSSSDLCTKVTMAVFADLAGALQPAEANLPRPK